MSLQAQILSFVERVAEKFAGADARIGGIDQLDTLDKSNLVTAINELAARGNGGSTSGGGAYTHLQSLANTVWSVSHQFTSAFFLYARPFSNRGVKNHCSQR